jgi:hypothetical protein
MRSCGSAETTGSRGQPFLPMTEGLKRAGGTGQFDLSVWRTESTLLAARPTFVAMGASSS